MAKHLDLGRKGEELAVNFLKKKGYTILNRNKVLERVEIDIIAQLDDLIVFVEVKTRSNDFYGNPEDAVTYKKEENFLRAVDAYLEENEINNEIRMDIISIIYTNNSHKIMHFEDAITPYDE